MTNGQYITTVTVIDPSSKQPVEIEIYKLAGGGMIGIDASFLETEEPVYSPFDEGVEIHPNTFEDERPSSEEVLIQDFTAKRADYDRADSSMRKHFKEKHMPAIVSATTVEELQAIKEQLRIMPEESVGKTLLFRSIIMKEEEIFNKLSNNNKKDL